MTNAQLKIKVFDIIGKICALHSFNCKGELTVDHINGRDYAIENLGGNKWKVYLEEAKRGLLRPLCSFHNSSLGGKKSKRFRNFNHHIEGRKCFCSRCKNPNRSPVFFFGGGAGRHRGGLHGRIVQKSGGKI